MITGMYLWLLITVIHNQSSFMRGLCKVWRVSSLWTSTFLRLVCWRSATPSERIWASTVYMCNTYDYINRHWQKVTSVVLDYREQPHCTAGVTHDGMWLHTASQVVVSFIISAKRTADLYTFSYNTSVAGKPTCRLLGSPWMSQDTLGTDTFDIGLAC